MKVRVSYTVDVSDRIRLAIRSWNGQDGLATRREVQQWYEENGLSADDELLDQQVDEDVEVIA